MNKEQMNEEVMEHIQGFMFSDQYSIKYKGYCALSPVTFFQAIILFVPLVVFA